MNHIHKQISLAGNFFHCKENQKHASKFSESFLTLFYYQLNCTCAVVYPSIMTDQNFTGIYTRVLNC